MSKRLGCTQTIPEECAQCNEIMELAYGKRLRAAARIEFRSFWSAYRYWLVFAPWAVAVVVHIVLHGFSNVGNLVETLVIGVGGFALSILGTYVIAMRKGAEVLDAQRHDDLSARDRTITELSAKLEDSRRDPSEEHHRAIAARELSSLSATAKQVLRYIWTNGKLEEQDLQNLALPELDTVAVRQVLDGELRNLQIMQRHEWHDFSGDHTSWEIPPGFRTILGKLLFAR